MKLTPWMPGTTKPVRKGLYQRLWLGGPSWAIWDGENWHRSYDTSNPTNKRHAIEDTHIVGPLPLKWRGVKECSK